MKFSCERDSFTQAITTASKALPSKPSTPILAGILVKAENNILEICATDNETSIIIKITENVNIEVPGSVIFVGRYFADMVRNVPGDTITIEYDRNEQQAQIKSEKLKYTLQSMCGEFPFIEEVDSDLDLILTNKQLCALISRTQYACSTDTARPIFTGCVLQVHGKTVTMAGTNTHQLAIHTVTLDKDYEKGITVTVPGKILSNIEKLIASDVPVDVEIKMSSRKIAFNCDNGRIQIITRLIEGAFPDYRRVIPLDFKTRVTIKKDEFSMALRRISVISNTSEHRSCKFEFCNNSVRISANNPDIGYSEEIISAQVDGYDLTISFNSDYLSRVMNVIASDNFIFSMNTNLSAAAIRETDSNDFTYIITPIRTIG